MLPYPFTLVMHHDFNNMWWQLFLHFPFLTNMKLKWGSIAIWDLLHEHVMILIELVLMKTKTATLFATWSCNSGYVAISGIHFIYVGPHNDTGPVLTLDHQVLILGSAIIILIPSSNNCPKVPIGTLNSDICESVMCFGNTIRVSIMGVQYLYWTSSINTGRPSIDTR